MLGSVHDNESGVTWTLQALPFDGGAAVDVASGSGEVAQALLGHFDPTMLRNGLYELVLTATDIGGHHSAASVIVELEGALKLGNFTISFADLTVPVAGIPITVTRTYDTLRADLAGDFGYGWTLDLSNTQVSVTHAGSVEVGMSGYTPFRDGDRVVITLPDGSKQGFTFYGEPTVAGGMFQTGEYRPKFIPDVGVKSQLIVEPRYLFKLGDIYLDAETGYGSSTYRVRVR